MECVSRPALSCVKESSMSQFPALTSPFMLAEGDTLVRAQGALTRVTEEQGLQVAAEKNSAVVGVIPFDPDAEPYLVVPDRLTREQAPVQLPAGGVHQPQPVELTGLDNAEYRQAVAQAVELMNRGELDKVVLARLLRVSYREELNLPHLFDTLRAQQPRATVFSVEVPGGAYLMGASPELVLQADAQGFQTVPLAGSAPRTSSPGSTDDAQAAEQLLRSAKDRAEHATVVRDIEQRLTPLTRTLVVPPAPSLLSTPQLWHLSTPIRGVLQPGISSLDAARAIHPTPAICGTPTDVAQQLVSRLEPFERGYFGGLVGYMDARGFGSWFLALRCALVEPQQATLFAGAGIVKDSTPAGEHAETATKLGTFARALGIDIAETPV